jgi:predicted transcriptional regulator
MSKAKEVRPEVVAAGMSPMRRHPAFEAAVLEGIASADAGRTIPYEEVRRWLLSWGTSSELPSPTARNDEIVDVP